MKGILSHAMLALGLGLSGLAVGTSARAALPEPLAHYAANPCSFDLLSRESPAFELTVQQMKEIDTTALSAAERKGLFQLAMATSDTYLPIASPLVNRILGMRMTEVSEEIWESENREPHRFGDEYTWGRRDGMATHSFVDFHRMFAKVPLEKGQTVVDIGAGFGSLGIYLAIMHPGVKFIGYELVPERVAEFNRVAALLELGPDVRMITQNLADPEFHLPPADLFYSWNPVNDVTGAKLWQDLAQLGQQHAFRYLFYGLGRSSPEKYGFRNDRNRDSRLYDSPVKYATP